MGRVYEAVHLRLTQKHFAIKVLHPAATSDAVLYARFRREAEITSQIGHAHIVEVLDFNLTPEGQPYLVMEYLEGENLMDRLQREGQLPIPDLRQIVEQVGTALQAAHDKGVVHRDLKPENIFLQRTTDSQISAKLVDFGLSKIRHSLSTLTQSHAVMGTPHCMAPEQAEGRVDEVDHRSDIFAFGVVVYHCLTGVDPFAAPSVPGILYRVCHSHPRPASALRPGLSPRVEQVVSRAMAKQRADRYQQVSEVTRDLCEALSDGASESPPVGSPRATCGTRSRHATSAEARLGLAPTEPPLPSPLLPTGDARTGEKTVVRSTRWHRTQRVQLIVALWGIILLALGATAVIVVANWGTNAKSQGTVLRDPEPAAASRLDASRLAAQPAEVGPVAVDGGITDLPHHRLDAGPPAPTPRVESSMDRKGRVKNARSGSTMKRGAAVRPMRRGAAKGERLKKTHGKGQHERERFDEL